MPVFAGKTIQLYRLVLIVFTLAHLSDPHLAPLPRPTVRELVGKRVLGFVHWQRKRCAIHRRDILDALVRDLAAQPHDHVAVTGDLVNIALESEFAPSRAWIESLGPPADVTVIPGNHDIYVRAAIPWPAKYWGGYMRSDAADRPDAMAFPFVRRRRNVAIIGLSSGVPSPPLMATGRLGDEQLHRLATALRELDGLFRIVLIHHPLQTVRGSHKRLIDAAALRNVLAENGAELLLHGHDHVRALNWLDGPRRRIPAVGVPSASALAHGDDDQAGYNLYRIDDEAGAWRCEMTIREVAADGKARSIARKMLT
jgi:3',5'-cyclic AMP phosphodiesterase CpdA